MAQKQRIKRETFLILSTGLLFLSLFQSDNLLTWLYDLPSHPIFESMIIAGEAWHDLMNSIGTADVTEYVRQVFLDLISA